MSNRSRDLADELVRTVFDAIGWLPDAHPDEFHLARNVVEGRLILRYSQVVEGALDEQRQRVLRAVGVV